MKKKHLSIQKIQKRDGIIVPFDEKRIFRAVTRATSATGEGTEQDSEKVADKVLDALVGIRKGTKNKAFTPHVELIQDIVEYELIALNFPQTAKAYIIYRKTHAEMREKVGFVPEKVRELVTESKKYFRNPLAEFVYYRTYAKWIPEEGRRETWIETVDRYMKFMHDNMNGSLTPTEYSEIREAILKQEAMPSMRLLQFAGKAASKTNVCAYNCSFIAPETFVGIKDEKDPEWCINGNQRIKIENNHVVCINGVVFEKRNSPTLNMLKDVYVERKVNKKKMMDKKEELSKVLNEIKKLESDLSD